MPEHYHRELTSLPKFEEEPAAITHLAPAPPTSKTPLGEFVIPHRPCSRRPTHLGDSGRGATMLAVSCRPALPEWPSVVHP
jgi:hypothetical protein